MRLAAGLRWIASSNVSRSLKGPICSVVGLAGAPGESAGAARPREAAIPEATWESASASLDGSSWLVDPVLSSWMVTNLSGET